MKGNIHPIRVGLRPLLSTLILLAAPAAAQDTGDDAARGKMRTRVTLGPQIGPRYPGADTYNIFPMFNLDRARGETPFTYEAPDESIGPAVFSRDGFVIGPAINFQGSRRRRDTDGRLPKVGWTVEAGVAASYFFTPALRARGEIRKGIGGHKGWVGSVGADYVVRDADRWLWSVGPRLTIADGRYSRAYFGVAQADAAAAALPAFNAKGGIQSVGGAAEALKQLGGGWGVYGYAKYDRLVDDAARSPVVREFGSKNQLSGGIGIAYTF